MQLKNAYKKYKNQNKSTNQNINQNNNHIKEISITQSTKTI